ncbi:leucine-rich repeat-containing protein 27-like [Tribolium madens]|uniref:leucine-rich repeat-containing protein 27-like n=1 Tax=Tribolium madens TaxID=41895 RepID=UPI001CF71E7C|nr:leucine-rich repeat-containing protein 27-like [Tribolium madens]XP_044271059.1 leucine-rich repeat-containing protein 27-like [Tribolium madens]
MSEFDIIFDSSAQNLKEVPSKILQMHHLKMLYLHQNFLKELPQDFFLKLPQLAWLDLRHNHLTTIPPTIAHHQHLENLLLSDNKIEVLPNELGLVPNLKVLQVANNPLAYPNARVVAEGTRGIVGYLRRQYEKIAQPPSEEEIRLEDYSQVFPMEESRIVHKISDSRDTILLKSFYEAKASQTGDSITFIPPLRHSWMDKLKRLLEEQERILQQERNLQALTSWRYQKKTEPKRISHQEYQTKAPYATQDMEREIDRMIQKNKKPKKEDVDKLISDLVGQLKDMEASYAGSKSPRSEIETAGTQIKKIMSMQKKLLQLQETNDLMLQ